MGPDNRTTLHVRNNTLSGELSLITTVDGEGTCTAAKNIITTLATHPYGSQIAISLFDLAVQQQNSPDADGRWLEPPTNASLNLKIRQWEVEHGQALTELRNSLYLTLTQPIIAHQGGVGDRAVVLFGSILRHASDLSRGVTNAEVPSRDKLNSIVNAVDKQLPKSENPYRTALVALLEKHWNELHYGSPLVVALGNRAYEEHRKALDQAAENSANQDSRNTAKYVGEHVALSIHQQTISNLCLAEADYDEGDQVATEIIQNLLNCYLQTFPSQSLFEDIVTANAQSIMSVHIRNLVRARHAYVVQNALVGL